MKIGISILFIATMSIFGFIPSMPVLDYSTLEQLDLDGSDRDEKVLEEIQAQYIEMMLTKPLFESDVSIMPEDDEEDFLGTKQEKEFFNSMMSRELAKQLAKKDLLGLKKLYLN